MAQLAKTSGAGKMLRVRRRTRKATGSPRAQAKIILDAVKHRYEPSIDIEKTTHAKHEQLAGLFIEEWLRPQPPALPLLHEQPHAAALSPHRRRAP